MQGALKSSEVLQSQVCDEILHADTDGLIID